VKKKMSITQTTKIVVYDLPSENYKVLKGTGLEAKVRSVRVGCVERLHRLGLQCTESVIIVNPRRLSEVEATIETVNRKYEALRNLVAHIIPSNLFTPKWWVIPFAWRLSLFWKAS